MQSLPFHLLGTADDLSSLHDLRHTIQHELIATTPALHLLNSINLNVDLPQLLQQIQRSQVPGFASVCLWGDHLLQQVLPLWNNHLQLRQVLRQHTQHRNQMAWVLHIHQPLLDWLSEVGFYDFISAGHHSAERVWRLRRCARAADKAAKAALHTCELPETFDTLSLNQQEVRLLKALYQAAPKAIATDRLCALLSMNPQTRSLLNLISKANRKCVAIGYAIQRISGEGYHLTQHPQTSALTQ